MKLLALDTSTETLSAAVQHGANQWQHQGVGGAQASFTLLPTIQRLMQEAGLRLAELDAIVFGQGPGSFTGLRSACAVAQGLGYGAGVPLLPVCSLLAVAEQARQAHGLMQVVAVLDARMNQVYAAHYDWNQAMPWLAAAALLAPEAVRLPVGYRLVGNAWAVYGKRLPDNGLGPVLALPHATALLALAPRLLQAGLAVAPADALPLYVRDQVARTTLERAQDRAAALP